MKTISNIIREVFATKRESRKSQKENNILNKETASGATGSEKEINQNSLTQNQTPDETATDENAGDSGVADTPSPQTDGNVETEQQTLGSGSRGTESKVNDGNDEAQRLYTQADLDILVDKAFQKGLIAGRNQKIEETYFPKRDDGIPHFRGNPSRMSPAADIFSMAREA